MQSLHLPEGRFVPSTKRWNLVWADQIIPNNITSERLKFAATHYVATQKIWTNQVAQFRAINPNFLCLAYHLAAGLNPAHNSDVPDPKFKNDTTFIGSIAPKGYVNEYTEYFLPWLAKHSSPSDSIYHETFFQHYDTALASHRVWHNDPAWLMAIGDFDYHRYLSDVTRDWMQGNADDGCFFDVAVEMFSSLYNPKASDPAPYNFDWTLPPHHPAKSELLSDFQLRSQWVNRQFFSCYGQVHNSLHHDTTFLVIPNVDQMVTTVYDPVWLDGDTAGVVTIDGAMMESFGGYRGQDMWLSMERCIRHITGRGKILIAQFYDASQTERYRRTAMYMLVKNENSYLNILGADGVEWYPEYEIDLGDQSPLPSTLDSLRIMGSGYQSLWARDYAKGKVLVNTSDAAMSISLASDAQWAEVMTQGGGKIADDGTVTPYSINSVPVTGPITIPPGDAVILTRTDLQAVQRGQATFVTITPNPVSNRITVHFERSQSSNVEIGLVNVLGRMEVLYAGAVPSGEQRLSVGTQSLPAGLYECIIKTSTGQTATPLIIQH
jgi:hypothetical protein